MGGVDVLCVVRIIGPDQGIAEVPRVFLKQSIVHFKAEGTQVFDQEDGRCPGVAFSALSGSPCRI